MNIKRTVTFPPPEQEIISEHPPEHFGKEDQMRTGFEKGTLEKAVFTLHDGTTITYEVVTDEVSADVPLSNATKQGR